VPRRRTLRGTFPKGFGMTNAIRLQLNNGDFTSNWRVIGFNVFPNMGRLSGNIGAYNTATQNNQLVHVALALELSGITTAKYEFADSRQIAWFSGHGIADPDNYRTHLDLEHIVIQDLWLGAYAVDVDSNITQTLSVELNYSVEIEEVTSTMNEAVMQLIKERSQDV